MLDLSMEKGSAPRSLQVQPLKRLDVEGVAGAFLVLKSEPRLSSTRGIPFARRVRTAGSRTTRLTETRGAEVPELLSKEECASIVSLGEDGHCLPHAACTWDVSTLCR